MCPQSNGTTSDTIGWYDRIWQPQEPHRMPFRPDGAPVRHSFHADVGERPLFLPVFLPGPTAGAWQIG